MRAAISKPESPRAYPLLWGGTASSNLADGIVLAAAPLLAASITRDPALVAGIIVAQRLPWFLFVLFAGVIVDRVDRRLLLVLGNALRVVALGGVTLALVGELREIWVLYIAAFLLGIAETVVDNAALAILPSLIVRDRIPDANGRLFATQSILNELAGPPLGALIFSLSALAAFATGSAAYLLAVVVFMLLPRRPDGAVVPDASGASRAPRASVRVEIADGLRLFASSRILVLFACLAAACNFSTAAGDAVLVLLAQDRLGVGEAGFGLLLAAAAIGGVPAGLFASRVIRPIGEAWVMIGSTISAGLAILAIALTTSVWVAGAAMFVMGFGFTLGNVVAISVRQTSVPDDVLGRVTSVYRLIAIGAAPLGALAGGFLAREFGITAPFWAAGVFLTLVGIAVAPVLLRTPIPRPDELATDPDPEPGDAASRL